jgi:hypothetical protein
VTPDRPTDARAPETRPEKVKVVIRRLDKIETTAAWACDSNT